MFATIFTKRHPQVGARPGTLVIPKQARQPKNPLDRYTANDVREVDVNVVEISKRRSARSR